MDDRVHLPKLTHEQIVAGIAGWQMMELEQTPTNKARRQYPVFRCPFCFKNGSLKGNTIEASGVINDAVICRCGQFQKWCLLDDWPPEFKKEYSEVTVSPSNL